ncbi:ArsR/SmtB family transcription factor [Sneathiella sp.]|uniref:ArsR/SmtB family transcription factor n=1 Tax=Sneathiella sp. TaxID=1964365 RepID=UPI0039E3006C
MEQLLQGLRAAGEETRMRLLVLCGHAELTVSELIQILGQSQPRVSRHLKLLCDAGLLDRFQEGSWVYYRLANKSGTSLLARYLVDLVPEEDPVVSRDLERLNTIKQARLDAADDYFRENAKHWNKIRSLHVAEKEVERLILSSVQDMKITDFLDIGTGTGRMLELFGPLSQFAVGVDTSREMLAFARAAIEGADLRNCQVRLGDMYTLPFLNDSQDVVVIHQVLHYADRPKMVIAEAKRVLRKNGRLVLVDFAPHEVETLRTEHAHTQMGFDADQVWSWCEEAGLKRKDFHMLAGDPLNVNIWIAEQSNTDNPSGERE